MKPFKVVLISCYLKGSLSSLETMLILLKTIKKKYRNICQYHLNMKLFWDKTQAYNGTNYYN